MVACGVACLCLCFLVREFVWVVYMFFKLQRIVLRINKLLLIFLLFDKIAAAAGKRRMQGCDGLFRYPPAAALCAKCEVAKETEVVASYARRT